MHDKPSIVGGILFYKPVNKTYVNVIYKTLLKKKMFLFTQNLYSLKDKIF